MPISCLSIGFAACQSCLTGKVNYSHWVEDRGRIIPFSHANSSIISYKKCINGWLKFVSTKPIRMTSRKYCFPWSKVFLPTECYDFGVPDLLRNHRYALRLGWPDSSSSTLKTEENMILWACLVGDQSCHTKYLAGHNVGIPYQNLGKFHNESWLDANQIGTKIYGLALILALTQLDANQSGPSFP
jgi:hypothetical protein